MKIGILTYHHVINDGAVLQTLGHVYTLRELFPEATIEVIDYRHATIERIERREAFKALIKLKKGPFPKSKNTIISNGLSMIYCLCPKNIVKRMIPPKRLLLSIVNTMIM